MKFSTDILHIGDIFPRCLHFPPEVSVFLLRIFTGGNCFGDTGHFFKLKHQHVDIKNINTLTYLIVKQSHDDIFNVKTFLLH